MKLIAGYHAGEFGHLLFTWQGIIRHMAENYPNVIIGCEEPMEFLFKDFANEFVHFPYEIHSRNMWMTNQQVYMMANGKGDNYIYPSKDICLDRNIHQSFVKWGKIDIRHQYDILLHARSTTNLNTGYRNWDYKKWVGLVNEYNDLNIACIGSKNGSWYIPGTKDLRGIGLEMLSDVMFSSTMLLSPSSGPAHFASLCGCPHIVWSDKKDVGLYDNEARYKEHWNPFKTDCVFIPKWQPTLKAVIKQVDKWLLRLT